MAKIAAKMFIKYFLFEDFLGDRAFINQVEVP